jgi:hypothetical protein
LGGNAPGRIDGELAVASARTSPVLQGELFGPLRDLHLFEQVTLDREVHTLVWPNGADFDPATLHDWPSQPSEVTGVVEHWEKRNETASKTT